MKIRGQVNRRSGFPCWSGLGPVNLPLVDDIPCLLDVLKAIRASFIGGELAQAQC